MSDTLRDRVADLINPNVSRHGEGICPYCDDNREADRKKADAIIALLAPAVRMTPQMVGAAALELRERIHYAIPLPQETWLRIAEAALIAALAVSFPIQQDADDIEGKRP